MITVPPGGEADVAVVARAAADAIEGENYGFVVLRNGNVMRRVPYFFLVDRPALAGAPVLTLKRRQSGDTRTGDESRERVPLSGRAVRERSPTRRRCVEDGAETLYETLVDRPAVNAGVSVISESPGAQIDPFYLGAADENTVQGFAGTPVNVNALMSGYLAPIGAAGAAFPRQQRFFVAVDSGRDPFSGRRKAGRFVLRSWVDDVTPPSIQLLTASRRRRAADPRAPRARRAVRRRSELADDRIPRRAHRRVGIRPEHRARGLPAPERGAEARRRNGRAAARRLRLPGGEEHRHGRAVDHAEHPLDDASVSASWREPSSTGSSLRRAHASRSSRS